MSGPSLVVMAAGIGSRYGGLKQVEPVGPSGEIIIEYSLYDAARAGFTRAVFVIKREIEEVFREKVGRRSGRAIEVRYAFQEMDDLPTGYAVPEGRAKPWGTGQAVLAARDQVDGPFAVINGDDFYGRESFQLTADFLKKARDDERHRFAVVGYPVENTLTEHGHVARGVCRIGADGFLSGIIERSKVSSVNGQAGYSEDGENWTELPPGTLVSMNLWGFTPGLMSELEERFPAFLEGAKGNPLKAEYLLPSVVDDLIREDRARVEVLRTSDRWYGVTYREDREAVAEGIAGLVRAGQYPRDLWGGA